MERRAQERLPSSLPVAVKTAQGTWTGSCINLSDEGALLKLESTWHGEEELEFQIDPHLAQSPWTKARVIRATSPDHHGAFLAVRLL